MIPRPFVVAAALLSFAACASSPDPAAVRAELLEADRAFARQVAERRAEAWVAAFVDSGMMFGDGGPVAGRDSIRAVADVMFEDTTFTLTWEPTMAVSAAAGDLGYTVGRWESARRRPDGSRSSTSGSYVTIWQREPEGSWRVAVDVGTPDRQE
jgi:ketosteroid isomerase-like protein